MRLRCLVCDTLKGDKSPFQHSISSKERKNNLTISLCTIKHAIFFIYFVLNKQSILELITIVTELGRKIGRIILNSVGVSTTSRCTVQRRKK